jgi:hypothetical protein
MTQKTYSFVKRLRVRIFGYANLEKRQPQGFSAPLMFCLSYCKKHGYYEDYWHGSGIPYLTCPKCLSESKTEVI